MPSDWSSCFSRSAFSIRLLRIFFPTFAQPRQHENLAMFVCSGVEIQLAPVFAADSWPRRPVAWPRPPLLSRGGRQRTPFLYLTVQFIVLPPGPFVRSFQNKENTTRDPGQQHDSHQTPSDCFDTKRLGTASRLPPPSPPPRQSGRVFDVISRRHQHRRVGRPLRNLTNLTTEDRGPVKASRDYALTMMLP